MTAAGQESDPSPEVVERHEDGAGGYVEILEVGDEAAPCRFRMKQTPGVGPPAAEFHPHQAESFRVLQGGLDLGVIDGERVVVGAGQSYELPPGVHHLPRAANDEPAVYESTLTPGMEMARVFEALFRYERERSGLGKVLRIALTLQRYRESMRLAEPLGTVMRVLALFAKLFGIRA